MKQVLGEKLVPIDSVVPYERNSRRHPPEQIKVLAERIKKGFDSPIVVDENMVVIKGHGRLEALKSLGATEALVKVREGLTDAEKRAERIADNEVFKLGEDDLDNLKIELGELYDLEVNLSDLGFDETRINEIDIDLPDFDSPGAEPLGEAGEDDGRYTRKIEAPIYEPKGDKPNPDELYDRKKYEDLVDEILGSDLPEEEKEFLIVAAGRHIVFSYEKIAEYYAHAAKKVQGLMERSALVIIDFDKAIENGFTNLSAEIAEAYKQ